MAENKSQKDIINSFGKMIKESCVTVYTGIVDNKLKATKTDPSTKLGLYAHLKNDYKYESYLDSAHIHRNELSKFRLSSHWLPIERGRYVRPKLERSIICKKSSGQ